MQDLWIVTCEVVVQADDLSSGNTNAFVNVVAYAQSPDEARQKVTHCVESYKWKVIGIEACRAVDPRGTYEEDVAEIIDEVRANPQFVIYGRMFSFRPD